MVSSMEKQRLEAILEAVATETGRRISQKNATRNAVNIDCPFCGDSNSHLGVFITSLRYHCFRCRATGSLRYLLYKFGIAEPVVERMLAGTAIPRDHAVGLAEDVRRRLNRISHPPVSVSPQVELPSSWPVDEELVEDTPLLAMWLAKRKITTETLMLYDARWTGNTGRYPHRLVVPVYDTHGQLAAWQARDVTGRSETKYLTEGRISELVYWTDMIRENRPVRLYIVEGIFDAWRIGVNAAATFSHAMSRTQRVQIINDPWVHEAVIAWDADSYELGKTAARQLSPVMRAGVVKLPVGEDPDSLGRDALYELPIEWV